MKEQKSTSPDYYLSLYKEWKSSGLPIGLFCERASVKYATFRYWVKKIEESSIADPGFTELRMNQGHPEPIVVVSFPTGASLSFYQLPDTSWLKMLLS